MRLADRQVPLLERRQEHRVPLEPLRPVEREQVDAVRRARPLVRGARLELREHRARRPRSRRPGPTPWTIASSVSSDACRSRASSPSAAAVLLEAHGVRPALLDRVREADARRVECRPAPQALDRGPHLRPVVEAQAADAYATPARVSASSIGASWAFIRTSTAISAGAIPSPSRARIAAGEPVQLRVRRRMLRDLGLGTVAAGRLEALRPPLRGEQPVRERQDLGRGPVVPDERDLLRPGPALGERRSGTSTSRPGERVDRLVLVADDAQVAATRRATARAAAAGAGSCPGTRPR